MSSLRCSNCKRLGHTAKTCRSKAVRKEQRAKKVDEVEADVEQCESDSGSYGELEEHDIDCLSEDDFE